MDKETRAIAEEAAKRLVEKRLLLEDDVKLYVKLARRRDIGLPSQWLSVDRSGEIDSYSIQSMMNLCWFGSALFEHSLFRQKADRSFW